MQRHESVRGPRARRGGIVTGRAIDDVESPEDRRIEQGQRRTRCDQRVGQIAPPVVHRCRDR
jgi:hypothetical protein